LTFRPTEQGSQRQLDAETRREFWSGAIFSESFFDVEQDLAEQSMLPKSPRYRLIGVGQSALSMISPGCPRIWSKVYDRLACTPARILRSLCKPMT